jgi:hypothetical protein
MGWGRIRSHRFEASHSTPSWSTPPSSAGSVFIRQPAVTEAKGVLSSARKPGPPLVGVDLFDLELVRRHLSAREHERNRPSAWRNELDGIIARDIDELCDGSCC